MRTPKLHVAVFLIHAALVFPAAGQTVRLEESPADSRIFRVRQSMKLSGTLSTPITGGKTIPLKMTASAEQSFRSRRIPGLGRDAKAYRSLRYYDAAEMKVTVNKEDNRNRLSSSARTIIAQGGENGLTLYSPKGPIGHYDRDLLAMPGDALSLIAFLPPGPAKAGQSWTPPTWAVQLMTGIDAVSKSTVSCRLTRADDREAGITLSGTVQGARDGAPTEITLNGRLTYNRKRRYIASLRLKQREKSKPGPVSPALDVTAEITVDRGLAKDAGPLESRVASRLSLDPNPGLLKLRMDVSDRIRFDVDRDWHVVFKKRGAAILRLLDEGNLVAQVNVRPLPTANTGKRISDEQFQRDIAMALGTRIKKVLKAEQIKPKDKPRDTRYLYRVTIDGKDNGIDMQWRYYLCASPGGQQVSLVFAVESKLVKQLADRDVGFVMGLLFIDRK